MFSVVRDLYYLASEAAYLPVRFAQALAAGAVMGWQITRENDASYADIEAAYEREAKDAQQILAEAEAEREVWEPVECNCALADSGPDLIDCHALGNCALLTSPLDGEAEPCVVAGPPCGERPEAISDIRPSVASGHPNRNERLLCGVAAYGLRAWMDGETCHTPTYFRSIARDLEHLAK
jgi:hypothetical protein